FKRRRRAAGQEKPGADRGLCGACPRRARTAWQRIGDTTVTSEISEAEKQQLLQATIAGRYPDERGRYGPFGGRYVPETLIPAMERLAQGVREHLHSPAFQQALGRE